MDKNNEVEYGIKYRVTKLEPNKFILFPVSIEEGETLGFDFKTSKEEISLVQSKNDLKNKYVIDNVVSPEDLKIIYNLEDEDLSGDDNNFLRDYFYNDYKDIIIYVEINKDNDIIKKYEINLQIVKETEEGITYLYDKDIPAIALNQDVLNDILSCTDINEIKILLEKYKRLVPKFEELNKNSGITKIKLINGKIDEIETVRKVEGDFFSENCYSTDEHNKPKTPISALESTSEISYQGLRKAIKEKVFGHDEAIDTFAQKLYMNYTAKQSEGIDSILLVGPTGTGKTETVNAACAYLDIPSVSVNASNIVPQGIKGMSIEDVISSLYGRSLQNLEKAQRGLIFLDEFDKLNDSELDIKIAIKNILLTFTGGGIFPVDNEYYNFIYDSSMTNKVFAGVFDKITDIEKVAGFDVSRESKVKLGTEQEIRKKIIEKKYFTLEELSRISTILAFEELSRETKKQILLESKLSELSKKRARYKRQFGIDIMTDDGFIEALIDSVSSSETGMRSINNIVKRVIDAAEKGILENERKGYKRLILTKESVSNPNKFDLS